MGTMGAKEIGEEPAAGPITVQPFHYAEFAGSDSRPSGDRPVPPAAPTLKIDRRDLAKPPQPVPWSARILQRALLVDLPGLGGRPLPQQLQVLMTLLGLFVVLAIAVLALDGRASGLQAEVSALIADATVHTQRLARAAPVASDGNAAAMAELRSSRDEVNDALQALGRTASGPMASELSRLMESWKPVDAAAGRMAAREKDLLSVGTLLATINEATPRLLALAEEIAAAKQQNASAREAGLLSQLSIASWRLTHHADRLAAGSDAAQAAQALPRDVVQLREATLSLLATSEGEIRGRLQQIDKISSQLQTITAANAATLGAAAEVAAYRSTLQASAERLRTQLASIQALTGKEHGGRALYWTAALIFVLLALAAMLAIMQVLLRSSGRRAQEAEAQRVEAQRLEQAAKRANEQNQAAILRLMNELQEVADGNLTAQATVTEDITGAIADSVNYTVEELRGLVGRINGAAEQVNGASTEAHDIATRLMTSSEEQARELKDTGANVLNMTAQIGEVSLAAGESARVAKVSLEAAERGQRAVYNQIAGMNEIREQIQETAKRIKRLGESSQEIGEIVELISDITEQTNVLALNAAIQAASAGEAGRGFSVVAEEVQRLADRSAEAAKQIAALVKTIQTDTQDAVAAMEKSTQGVVEGTKLSDAAGTALTDIGRVSRQLAELIERIAGNTQEQASSADGVTHAIERLLGVNEQTTEGTRRAAEAIGQLATLARELKNSVARFRVA